LAETVVFVSIEFMPSIEFTGSLFESGPDGQGEGAATEFPARSVAAVTSSCAILALLTVFLLCIVKRQKHNEDETDCPIEYDTECQVLDVGDEEGLNEEEEDGWDLTDFDRVVESAFEKPTYAVNNTADRLFMSDCDEIF
jgi:hypothetical protein